MSTEVAKPEPINIPGEVGTSTGTAIQTNLQPPTLPLVREVESQDCKNLREQKLAWATRSGENLGRIKSALEDEISFLEKGKTNDNFLTQSIAITAGILFTWLIFWGYLSWDNFSSYYARDTWASFIAVSKGNGSLGERASAATLFVMQVLSAFLLMYGVVMFTLTKKKQYVFQSAFAAVLLILTFILIATEVLTT